MSLTTDRIVKTPGFCGGRARIRDHRIPVSTLVEARRLGSSDENLLVDYPGIEQADLNAAWEYAAANTQEIERAIWYNAEPQKGDRRLALIVRGWQLGLTDAEIAEAFQADLAVDLTSAHALYQWRKDYYDKALPDLLQDTLREGLPANGSTLRG